jgi:hypothetical protein
MVPPGLNGPGALTCSSQPARELRDVSTLHKIFATQAKTPRCHNQEPRVGEMRSVGRGAGALQNVPRFICILFGYFDFVVSFGFGTRGEDMPHTISRATVRL